MGDQKRALVGELAELAHLELDAEEREALGTQLDEVLTYIRCLEAVNVEGVPEYEPAGAPRSPLRGDRAGPTFDTDSALAGVPQLRDRAVAVPQFKRDASED